MHTLLASPLAVFALLAMVPAGLPAQGTASQRPIPYPVDYSDGFQRALDLGTRSETGSPGSNYWQQWTDYVIRARLDVEARHLQGTTRITYHNNAPRPLPFVVLQLIQNHHAEGVARNRPAEVTGGMQVARITVDGEEATEVGYGALAEYQYFGTSLMVRLPRALPSEDSVVLELEWAFDIPQHGAGGRMGWNSDNFFYLAYWYPQMAVLDDVTGWHTDDFLGNAEFYMGFGSYDVTLEVPEGWTVMGTGRLVDAEAVMPEGILERLRQAERTDTVVHVLTAEDFGPGSATLRSQSGSLSWHFVSDTVRDVAYSVSRESRWDATRTPVGDRNGDGIIDYAQINTIWRESAPRWANDWRYAQHSIDFLSRWTGFPYPWPHMTAVEGGGIIGGGMEFPMMTLIGDYNGASDTALYGVTVHELAHMWVPMIVGTDERRRAWMDEGTTSFNTSAGENEFFPGHRWELDNYQGYLQIAGTDYEGELMRWSDSHNPGPAYGIASYSKPAALLWTLRGLLGEETFRRAYHTYVHDWAYKHPKPWDFFNTFDRVSGQDLSWFWRTFYYETWVLDQRVKDVRLVPDGTRIVVEDLGRAFMPTRLTLTTADGREIKAEIGVEVWLEGVREADIVVHTDSPVVRVEIDAEKVFPDKDRRNNVWERT
ncbi:MAG: M1 family metallopeptidase [Gemmatimonadales bacterium]|jgi:hypothetical protein